jgi:O-antigen/teichoic acid export membrane protein
MNSVFKKILRNLVQLLFLVSFILLVAYLNGGISGIITIARSFIITLAGVLILWCIYFFHIAKKYDFNKSLKRALGPILIFMVGFPLITYAINHGITVFTGLLIAGGILFISLIKSIPPFCC